MKRNEVALLILIVSISLVLAYFLGKAIVGEPGANGAQVEVVEPISADVSEPSARVFNNQAINPTVQVKIGDSSNQSPFTGEED